MQCIEPGCVHRGKGRRNVWRRFEFEKRKAAKRDSAHHEVKEQGNSPRTYGVGGVEKKKMLRGSSKRYSRVGKGIDGASGLTEPWFPLVYRARVQESGTKKKEKRGLSGQ